MRTYADRLPIVMTRPFNYTGVGQTESFLVPKLVAHFAQRRPHIELGNLDVVRDFSDVRTVAQAYVRLLTADVPEGVTNLCSGVGRSLRWVVEQLREISGHELDVRVNPEFVRASEVHRLVGSSSRMEAALGSLPFRDFRETLAWMLGAPSAPNPLRVTASAYDAVQRKLPCPQSTLLRRSSRPTTFEESSCVRSWSCRRSRRIEMRAEIRLVGFARARRARRTVPRPAPSLRAASDEVGADLRRPGRAGAPARAR